MIQYRKSKLDALNAFIRGINFAKVSDREVRSALIRLIPAVSRGIRELEEDGKAMFEKFIGPFPEERRIAYDSANRERTEALEKYRESGSEEDGKAFSELNRRFGEDFRDLIEAVAGYDGAMKEFMDGTVGLPVEAIGADAFLDALGDQCEITADTLAMLEPIVIL